MIGNSPYDRDELLVTGISPVAEPLTEPATVPSTDTRPLTEPVPVFVDASGSRARLGRRLGLLAGALLLVFLGALGLGMTTGTNVPLTPWSEPSAHPRVKVSHPQVKPTRTPEPPVAARPNPTQRVVAPAPSTAPQSSSSAAQPTPTAVPSTSRPGNSQVSPPAWGRKKKTR
ncbi:hypothetical protein [Actinomadura latina]|uniref:Uncharacterized protein n=1 Tax=Actinomadura latina TaxID=163603 RepID=A0A846Z281_9ACTN|nr:hypothetical protein [Actinomadura latina]NKZ04914.1 hypothetical protein [Actinomadura latina]